MRMLAKKSPKSPCSFLSKVCAASRTRLWTCGGFGDPRCADPDRNNFETEVFLHHGQLQSTFLISFVALACVMFHDIHPSKPPKKIRGFDKVMPKSLHSLSPACERNIKKSCLSHAFRSSPIVNASVKITLSKSEPFTFTLFSLPCACDSLFLLCPLSSPNRFICMGFSG